ncbi:MAG: signal peptidase I [Aquificae bacterium]|nr:signal peptidase I [Aquificota bacterium]
MRKQLVELALVLLLVLLVREYLAQAYNIPSASMEPTLLIGDFILVNKLLYRLSEPMRGDMVVFKYPLNPRVDFIKRIVAKGGDLVEFKELEGPDGVKVYELWVNGEPFKLSYKGVKKITKGECYAYEEALKREDGKVIRHEVCFSKKRQKMAGVSFDALELCLEESESGFYCKKFIVPEGHYFVMGDNRDNSEDSRFWGFVPRENVVGKAFVIYFSGKVPPISSPAEVSPLVVIRQIVYALLHPRPSRIGRPLIY